MAVHRGDVARIGWVDFDFSAQTFDGVVGRARLDLRVEPPDVAVQLVTRDRLAWMRDEVAEELGLLRRERHRRAVSRGHRATHEVGGGPLEPNRHRPSWPGIVPPPQRRAWCPMDPYLQRLGTRPTNGPSRSRRRSSQAEVVEAGLPLVELCRHQE